VWTEDEVDADEVAAVCLAAVKGIGYKAGLEHTVADCEIMSTQECSEDRAFLDGDSACGFTTAQDCRCSTGDTFNNWAALEDLYGRCD
jgi:hypothetical protein